MAIDRIPQNVYNNATTHHIVAKALLSPQKPEMIL